MRRVLFAMLLVAAPRGVSDLTWDFAESWAAQESSATPTVVSSESMVSSVSSGRRQYSEPALGCDHHRRSPGSALAGNHV